MKVAFVGLAQSGKSTVFQSLAGAHHSSKGAHDQAIQVANVKVPDSRLDRLAEIFNPPKAIYADIDFMDIAAVRTELKGAGLTQEVIAEIRSADAMVALVADFDNTSVVHPLGSCDPLRDIKNVESELCLADMIQIEKRLKKMEKERSAGLEKEALLHAKKCLDEERPLRLLHLDETEQKLLVGFSFLSQKPLLLLLNTGEDRIDNPPSPDLIPYIDENRLSLMEYSAEIELEISELEPEEQSEFLAEMGLEGSGKTRFIRKVYEMLNLISFFTIADTEIRAWSIPANTRAVRAAGKVHTDMERGFIRAEVIGFDEFDTIGSMRAARDSGRLRLEGKDYLVCDGDLIKFRFNV